MLGLAHLDGDVHLEPAVELPLPVAKHEAAAKGRGQAERVLLYAASLEVKRSVPAEPGKGEAGSLVVSADSGLEAGRGGGTPQ